MKKDGLANHFKINPWGIKSQILNMQTDFDTIIGIDAGGTKTLIGHVDTRTCDIYKKNGIDLSDLSQKQFYISDQFTSVEEIIGQYMKVNSIIAQRTIVCIAGAGPVQNNAIQMSNRSWMIDAEKVKNRYNFKMVYLINDLAALVYALDFIHANDKVIIHSGKTGPKRDRANTAIIAAGTGLGESMGIYMPEKNSRVAIASEGGNSDFAPGNDLEIQLYTYLKLKDRYVSWEDVLSGKGLVNIYEFLLQKDNAHNSGAHQQAIPEAEEISRRGLSGEHSVCRQALEIFAGIYGAEAGNIALRCLPYSGIYIMGGIAPKMESILKEPFFMKRFIEKGRMQPLLETIPVYLVLNSEYGIIGAINYAIIQYRQV